MLEPYKRSERPEQFRALYERTCKLTLSSKTQFLLLSLTSFRVFEARRTQDGPSHNGCVSLISTDLLDSLLISYSACSLNQWALDFENNAARIIGMAPIFDFTMPTRLICRIHKIEQTSRS